MYFIMLQLKNSDSLKSKYVSESKIFAHCETAFHSGEMHFARHVLGLFYKTPYNKPSPRLVPPPATPPPPSTTQGKAREGTSSVEGIIRDAFAQFVSKLS